MKKAVVAGAVVSLLALAGPVSAKNGGNGGGAFVEKGPGCEVILDESAETWDDFDARYMLVVTPSGNSKSQCHGQLPEGFPRPSRAVHVRGYPCFVVDEDFTTTDSHATITPSGNVSSTCFSKHNKK